jgi:hypothetical protein
VPRVRGAGGHAEDALVAAVEAVSKGRRLKIFRSSVVGG